MLEEAQITINGASNAKELLMLSVVGFEKDPLRDAIHTGIPSGSSAIDMMATSL